MDNEEFDETRGLMVIPIICITGMCVCQLLAWP